ncbi:PTS sugar transporter subunit IIA [Companilactobacillus hulinensis]|uniref:PTS sugar transporter subunit IIA n=1 Tax=Companilactobacillus hulinensis TaxID=2486007 RepID=UPI000F794FFD|nr:PTS glucose transporter subunit IIA [Companilactobacillus hulinensis]
MINLFKSAKKLNIEAPISGKIIPLETVSDEVFAQKMMGEGIAIIPNDSQIVSPVDGIVGMVADTKHALGIKAKNGLEIVLHLGIDTVELDGSPFTISVNDGDSIKAGQPLATMNIEEIKSADKDPVVMTLITNSSVKVKELDIASGNINNSEVVAKITLN